MTVSQNSDTPVIVIAGISGGIGSALAEILHHQGFRVAGYSRSAERAREAVPFLDDDLFVEADATDSASVTGAIEHILAQTGRIDGFANCVGSITLKSAHLLTDEDWDASLAINLNSAFYGLRACAKHMQKAGRGSVVLISTVAARTGLPAHEAVAAAKAGLHGLAMSAAASYASRRVRVNVVAPGMTETAMSAPILRSEQMRKLSEAMHPLGRIGKAGEVASLIAHLLSDQASWITGQIFSVDGGLSTIHQRPKV